MQNSKFVALMITASLLAGCTEADGSPGRGLENGGALSKANVGIAAGVVTGGLAGSAIGSGAGNTLAIIGGGLLGGYLGNEIGSSLDNADRAAYTRASQNAMQSGREKRWKNPDSGNYGTITPHRRYRDRHGKYCREYTQKIYVDGKRHKGHGTACREADGTWRIIE